MLRAKYCVHLQVNTLEQQLNNKKYKMRKLFFMLLFLAATILNCQALTVNNTAGGLASAVDDVNITVLKVTGTMDARDFLSLNSPHWI